MSTVEKLIFKTRERYSTGWTDPRNLASMTATQVTIDHPALQPTLDELCDLWAAKFGNGWIPVSEAIMEDFWEIVSRRLWKARYLERFDSFDLDLFRLCK